MTLKIAQDQAYAGNDFWRWSAWLTGPAAELAAVQHVKWLLHPSFTPSVIESSDREARFRIDCSGWGTFVLKAQLHRGSGEVTTLRKTLELDYPDADPAIDSAPGHPGAAAGHAPSKGAAVEAAPRKIFLSYGAEDRGRALGLRRTLQSLGIEVLDESQLGTDLPLELALRDLQAAADATVAFISSDTPSAFVAREVNAAMQSGKPTLVITSDDVGPILGVDAKVPVARTNPDDPSGISAALGMLKLG